MSTVGPFQLNQFRISAESLVTNSATNSNGVMTAKQAIN